MIEKEIEKEIKINLLFHKAHNLTDEQIEHTVLVALNNIRNYTACGLKKQEYREACEADLDLKKEELEKLLSVESKSDSVCEDERVSVSEQFDVCDVSVKNVCGVFDENVPLDPKQGKNDVKTTKVCS